MSAISVPTVRYVVKRWTLSTTTTLISMDFVVCHVAWSYMGYQNMTSMAKLNR